jgi:hypothetical protein
MKAKYNQLTNAGKPAKVALTAITGKADRSGKRSPEGQQTLDPKSRLIKTDTPAHRARAKSYRP